LVERRSSQGRVTISPVSTPERLGDRAAQFARDVDAAVTATPPDGVFTEPFRVEVLIARRPI
jgi:hypothetical protein